MTDQHSITPPPELLQQWAVSYWGPGELIDEGEKYIATQAARWGADMELEACLQWFSEFYCMETWMQKDLEKFRLARRPKPPSLAEQALEEINLMEGAMYSADLGCDFTATRRALERLQELEQN